MNRSVAPLDGLCVAATRAPIFVFHQLFHPQPASVLACLETMPVSGRNQRDLFPLPLVPDAVSSSTIAPSISQLKRARRLCGLGALINEASSGLNALAESKAGRPPVCSSRPPPRSSLPSRPRQLVSSHLRRSIRTYGRTPQDLSPTEALQELLRSKDTYDLDSCPTVEP